MKTELNIAKWKRKEHFNFFRDFDNPFFNICTNINITELLAFSRSHKYSFFLSSLFLSIKAANEITEFRYRFEADKVYEYDNIHPFSTILNDDDTFSFCEFNFNGSYQKFLDEGEKSIYFTKKNKKLLPSDNRLDVIHYTTIPWISLSSISHARNYNTQDCIPKIVFGKYFEQDDKFMLPISVEVHHSLVDGIHVGKFIDLLSSYMLNCNEILR